MFVLFSDMLNNMIFFDFSKHSGKTFCQKTRFGDYPTAIVSFDGWLCSDCIANKDIERCGLRSCWVPEKILEGVHPNAAHFKNKIGVSLVRPFINCNDFHCETECWEKHHVSQYSEVGVVEILCPIEIATCLQCSPVADIQSCLWWSILRTIENTHAVEAKVVQMFGRSIKDVWINDVNWIDSVDQVVFCCN